jgi:P27 family predicted phage terminase small subunit
MGKRGPKPKPGKLKVFEGNPSHRPIVPEAEPPVAHGSQPPEWLNEAGREIWQTLAPGLEALGLLTEIDLPMFAVYCHAWATFRRCEKEIADKGDTCFSDKGAEYQRPCVGIMNTAIAQIAKYGALFGLGTANRVGLKVDGGAGQEDELDQFKASG